MRKKNRADVSVFDEIKAGLEDSIAFSNGQISLVTSVLPSPPPKIEAKGVARVRKDLRMSQAYFAAVLNVSPKTVQSWEQGIRKPSESSLRLIQIVKEEPSVVRAIVAPEPVHSLRSAAKTAEKVHVRKSVKARVRKAVKAHASSRNGS